MNWQAVIGIGAGGGVVATSALWAYANSEVHKVDAVMVEPPSLVSIILPTYMEERYVEGALYSITNQNIVKAFRDKFEIIVVDSHSTDRTVEIAGRYADRVILAPKGLLTARTLAIERSNGDIVMAVNADSYYAPNFANILLRHFNDKNVVGVSGTRIHQGLTGPLTVLFYTLHPKPIMLGSNSAFLKSTFYKIGGWNLNIDQSKTSELQPEEEERFAKRLAQIGKVVFEPKAPAFTSSRRLYRELEPDHTSFA